MNRYKFIALNRQRQLNLLKVRGRILHRRIKRDYTISLYQIENFYIEIWENTVKENLENLVTFKDRTLLNYPFNMEREQRGLYRA